MRKIEAAPSRTLVVVFPTLEEELTTNEHKQCRRGRKNSILPDLAPGDNQNQSQKTAAKGSSLKATNTLRFNVTDTTDLTDDLSGESADCIEAVSNDCFGEITVLTPYRVSRASLLS
ncbi:hypothetical protein X801_03055 [Opisthorchis viverrini]|uniref:Uncharacterized protein n=2 Tax=Opisthorchis viverrini TaxID=6198 RepID=A0A1S8X304_OPIVI|nr:hypothetical protein T265_07422 [Opisthorchis viverrini]KER25026.1 hypothetical protein T265_07422 [Opisthorchis viverrini]OON21057.1 hypothetical protein X801_03055 [Opisthorchis viverrini]